MADPLPERLSEEEMAEALEYTREWRRGSSPSRMRAQVVALAFEKAIARLRALEEVANAFIAYDNAIMECGNDPDRMASHCTAQGDDLDALHAKILEALRATGHIPNPGQRGEIG